MGSKKLSVLEAVQKDLASIRKRAPEVADSGLAVAALVMAQELDDPDNSATSKSMCARALRDALDRLRELAPAGNERSRLDDLTERRETRLAGRAAS